MARVNLKQLAGILELSITTVSRALAGYGDVNPATRRRVVTAAHKYGYHPNPVARRLQKSTTEAIGIVLPTATSGYFEDPFYLEFLVGIGKQLAEVEYDLLLHSCPEGSQEIEVLKRLVRERRVDGLIVVRTRVVDRRISFLLDHDFPFIAFGRCRENRPYAYIDVDGYQAMVLACERLLGLGHKKIALFSTSEHLMYVHHRLEGYKASLQKAGIGFDRRLIYPNVDNSHMGYSTALRLIKNKKRPTAIICLTDSIAIGVLRALRELGLRAGRDLAVIGNNDLPIASQSIPPLTTLHQPIRAIGERLVKLLLDQIQHPASPPVQEIWQAELVIRQSDGPAPER